MSAIKRIRKSVNDRQVELSDHALEEMDDDDLSLADVRTVLLHGALHITQEDDPRGTRYIVRGGVNDEDVDVVCRFLSSGILWIITVYAVSEAGETDE